MEVNCDLLLMDERIGTKIARREGLQTIGLIGVLVRAKEERIIPKVGEVLNELRIKAGFWLSDNLQNQILKELGEI